LRQCSPITFGSTGFTLKLAPDGSQLIYSTYLGADDPLAVALDSAGDIYVVGNSVGALPLIPGSFGWIPSGAATGAFVAKLAPVALPSGTISCLLNAASGVGGDIAPGEIVDIRGYGIGPANPIFAGASLGRIDTSLGGVNVLFNDVPAPLLSAGPNQIRAIVPFEIGPVDLDASGTATIQIFNGSTTSEPATVTTAALAPGIFAVADPEEFVDRQAIMINQDGTLNSKENPAPQGSIVTIYATGLNYTKPTLATGTIAPGAASLALPIQVVSANFPPTLLAEITYAGAAPGFAAGITQINFRIPISIFHGFTPFGISQPTSNPFKTFYSSEAVHFYVK
jgi:uncharacterized protein (TIGR03437 family)